MFLGHGLGHGEPQADPLGLPGHEGLEDGVADRLGWPGPGVFNAEQNPAAGSTANQTQAPAPPGGIDAVER